jgi:hypothetical protein
LPDRCQRATWWLQRQATPLTRHLDQFRRPWPDVGQRIEIQARVPYLTADQVAQVRSIIEAKLPAGDLVSNVDQVGRRVTLTWTVRKRPPAFVGYEDLLARFDGLAENEFFLGRGASLQPVVINLHGDSPHVAISAGSGAGKSELAKDIAVQVLARNGFVTILDIKGSHRWALNMPGVDYCHTPEQIQRALIELDKLAKQRNHDALYEAEGWDPGPRHLVIAEELNATMAAVRDWWEQERPKGAQKIPPAITAYRSISAMGRSAKVNVVAIAQMLSANAAGGPEARENYGIRALARYTANNWKMLCPSTGMPRKSRVLGRWQIVVNDEAAETQVLYLTTTEARLFIGRHRAVHVGADTLGGRLARDVHMDHQGHVDMPAGPPPQMTLQDAIGEGVCDWPLATLQKRLQRARGREDPLVPDPVGKRLRADLYERATLLAWLESEMVS